MGDINWGSVTESILQTFFRFAAIYVSYFLTRLITEGRRNAYSESAPTVGEQVKSYGIGLLVVFVIAFSFWIDLFGGMKDEETGDVSSVMPPKQAHNFAAKIFITLLIPIMYGVYAAYTTPVKELQRVRSLPTPPDYDSQ